MEYNVLHTLQHMKVQGVNFHFYVNQYALGNKLLKNSRNVKPDTIRTAFLFGLELEMQVELLKRDKNDEIDTLEQCIAAAWKIHGEPHVPRQVVQNFYGYGWESAPKSAMAGAGASGSATGWWGPPMDLDALRYTWFVTSHFQGNVQFDRHPTRGGGWFFGANGVQSTLTERRSLRSLGGCLGWI